MHIYNICKYLSERGNDVFLAYFSHHGKGSSNEDVMNTIAKDMLLLDYPDFYDQIYGKLYKIFLSLYPFSHISLKPRPIRLIQENIRKFIATNNIDIIHVHSLITGLLLIDFRKTPKLLDLTDSMSLALKREIQENGFRKKMRSYLLYNWCKGIEKTLLRDSDFVTVVSPIDREMLKRLYRKVRAEVIPNGVDFNYFSPRDGVHKEYPSILFHGTMDFLPNIRAAKYICNEIFPIIKSEIPDARFLIVGSNPVDEIKKFDEYSDITVTGYVEDIRDYLSRASVCLYPMKSGSGIKNKILEAMAMGKPVVTNPLGVEALSEGARNCLLVGKTGGDIAAHVIHLLRDREKRVELGKKGREIVMKEYSWDTVAEKYENIYMELLLKMNKHNRGKQ